MVSKTTLEVLVEMHGDGLLVGALKAFLERPLQ